jgi:signal transduction histidine kinase/ActR/RegA family two-component response regulator
VFQSLRWRVPLFVCALIVVILVTLLVATQREIESTLVRAGRDRAAAAARQFVEPFTRAMRGNLDENARLGTDPAVRAFAAEQNPETREAALKAFAPRAPGVFRRVEVWTNDGTRILEISTPGKTASGQEAYFPSESAPSRTGISELRAAGELSYFDITSEIHDGSPAPRRLGYLRRYGRFTFTGNLKNLVGDGAIVRVGSTNGTWTDLFAVASPAPTPDPGSDIGEHHAADGQQWVGASISIEHTALVTWVGFPRALVVAPAQPFMRRMILLAIISLGVSVGLVTVLGIRLARRVQVLTRAAEQIAGGDYGKRVPSRGHDEVGQLSEAFNTMTDRVEHAHRALRESHERTQFALAAARIGVWQSHLGTGRMTCSDSIAIARGLAPDAVPRTIDAFLAGVHADDRESVRRVLEGREIEGDTFEIQYRLLQPDGSARWIEARGRRQVDDRGEPASVLGVSVDVTEQRRLESQLRQAQKMEAVGQLAGGVAHDFNNLLTAVVGHANLALEDLPDDHRVREDVMEILKAGERAAGLTRQLLAFSRRQVMQPEVIAVNDVISGVEKLLRRLIGEQIHIVLDLAASTDAVKVDPGQLEQVLINLAVNARDAMPDGGTLTLATTNVDLDEAYAHQHPGVGPGRYVMIAVTDTGTGMDAQTQTHLFEPFFTTKPAGKGTGLGLATVYGIVKQSGGFIYVYSEHGRGATFKVYLPATTEKPSTEAPRIEPARARGGTETILVVEDNPHVQAIARRVLAKLGYRVLAASSGEEALAVLNTGDARVDLVMSDVIMPGMTGPELCRQLSVRYPGLRVLFTSGYSNDAIVRHGVLEPGTMFIEKPYAPPALARKVREALGHQEPNLSRS